MDADVDRAGAEIALSRGRSQPAQDTNITHAATCNRKAEHSLARIALLQGG